MLEYHPDMRAATWFGLLGLSLAAGCVRAGFEGRVARDRSGASERDLARGERAPADAPLESARTEAGGRDAPGLDLVDRGDAGSRIDPAKLVKLTVLAPLLAAPAPTSNDCGRYLIHIGEGWLPTSFLLGGKLYFAVPCKYDDTGNGGWHTAFASWDGVAPAAQWLDGDPAAAGNQETISKFLPAPDGAPLSDQMSAYFAADASGALHGVARIRRLSSWSHNVPVVASSFASLSEGSYLVSLMDAMQMNLADGSFKGATELAHYDVIRVGATTYLYTQTANAPLNTKKYLSVIRSADMQSFIFPAAPLSDEYDRVHVARSGSRYFMVAFHIARGRWELIHGSGPESWDFAGAQDLNLRGFVGAAGAWDAELFTALGPEPYLAGVEVIGNHLHLFYMAGAAPYTAQTAPYTAARAIGALRVPLP